MIPFDANGAFHPKAGTDKLRSLAVRGAAVSVFASALSLLVQMVSTVMLARLLTPSDFGVVTMVTTFSLLVVNFGLNGFTEAVIHFEEIDHRTASNLFWINTGAGLLLTGAFAASGSLLARLYHNPLVTQVAVGISVMIVVSAASVIHLALLKRAMSFVDTSANDVIGRVVNTVVAIVLAFRGWGMWSLVAGVVAQQVSITLGAWWLCPWVPGLPHRTGRTTPMLRYAVQVYAQFCVGYSQQNIDNLLVGWRFHAAILGFYKKAYDLFALTSSQLTAPLNNVALAALSRTKQDHVLFRRYIANSLGMVAFIGMAASADLTLVGHDVVRMVLGPKWSESGRIFEIFAPGIGAMLLCTTVGWIHLSIGKPGRFVRWNIIAFAVTVSLFLTGLPFGPEGVAAAWSISYWTLVIPAFWYAGRPIGFKASALVGAIWRYSVAALAAGLISAAILRQTSLWATHSSTSAAFGAACIVSLLFLSLYLVFVILLHGGISPLKQLTGLLQELISSRRKRNSVLEENVVGELK
ncbi:MAG: lipopolysaccharide biosynthesis protein [Acidobacteria bacterium]|nr:lipopolysaccharide biosynthesis protein [Acidobacteriota bacterium]